MTYFLEIPNAFYKKNGVERIYTNNLFFIFDFLQIFVSNLYIYLAFFENVIKIVAPHQISIMATSWYDRRLWHLIVRAC